MSDAQLLLAAILDNPDDDGPRLAYADVLQQSGDPRGELIVVQCTLARESDPARRHVLEKRADQLLAKHAEGWTRTFDSRGLYRFARGFTREAQLYAPKRSRSLLAVEPVEHIQVGLEDSGDLLAFDGIERLRSLDLAEADFSRPNAHSMGLSIQWLADSPRIRHLRSLSIRTSHTRDDTLLPGRAASALVRWQLPALAHTAIGLVLDVNLARVLAPSDLGRATTFAIDDRMFQPGVFEILAEAWFADRDVTVGVPGSGESHRVLTRLGFSRSGFEAATFDTLILHPEPQLWRR
jgi:uncharacterized protein (TIGR02996 family)